jgi:hypothetical protein
MLTSSLHTYWQQQMPWEINTISPEMRVDTEKLDRWVTFCLQAVKRSAIRHDGLDMMDVSLVAHCLAQRGEAPAKLQELVDAVSLTMSTHVIPVRDYQQAGLPVVGMLQFFEPTIQIVSRSVNAPHVNGIPHVILTWDGWAQSLS